MGLLWFLNAAGQPCWLAEAFEAFLVLLSICCCGQSVQVCAGAIVILAADNAISAAVPHSPD